MEIDDIYWNESAVRFNLALMKVCLNLGTCVCVNCLEKQKFWQHLHYQKEKNSFSWFKLEVNLIYVSGK